MPNGFWYASGPVRTLKAKPASAFSKGDLLMFTSASSFSRWNEVGAGDWCGIAQCDSSQSIDGFVTALVPEPDTHFHASLSTAVSAVTAGVDGDILFSTANNRHYVTTSANSARVVHVKGTADLDQSVQSQALVRFLKYGTEADL